MFVERIVVRRPVEKIELGGNIVTVKGALYRRGKVVQELTERTYDILEHPEITLYAPMTDADSIVLELYDVFYSYLTDGVTIAVIGNGREVEIYPVRHLGVWKAYEVSLPLNWMPMPPNMGPPLPWFMGILWPWYKPPRQ